MKHHQPYGITQCYLTQVNMPCHNPARENGNQSTYTREVEGWVNCGVGYSLRWFTCPQTVTYPSSNHFMNDLNNSKNYYCNNYNHHYYY